MKTLLMLGLLIAVISCSPRLYVSKGTISIKGNRVVIHQIGDRTEITKDTTFIGTIITRR